MKPKELATDEAMLSIGALSRATGIPVDTLRTWERRYGFPVPVRTEGGHRKYEVGVIDHLRLVQDAIDRGYRPANVVGSSLATLRTLLDIADTPQLERSEPPEPQAQPRVGATIVSATVEEWMAVVKRMDAEALQSSFQSCWFRLGATNFLHSLVGPFLEEIGRAWYEGRIAVLHEQFASNQLRKFLSSHWRPLSERASGPHVVCATLPGEYHALGLHMTAVVMAIAGCRVIFLGCDSPIETIAHTAQHAQATLISVSMAANRELVREQIAQLQAKLPEAHTLLIGGGGAPSDIKDTVWVADLHALEAWALGACTSQL
jgi:methanogenic corrinoid protein MtbC1